MEGRLEGHHLDAFHLGVDHLEEHRLGAFHLEAFRLVAFHLEVVLEVCQEDHPSGLEVVTSLG